MAGNKTGTLIVSLDFELFWGMQDVSSLQDYQDHILGGRAAIPRLLDLFQAHGIHATWAAVGFLFAEDEAALLPYLPPEAERPSYADPALSAYRCIGTTAADRTVRDCFYAPELIDRIAGTPGQEIGSHTFSHYYCREAGQTPAQFGADMRAAQKIAADRGLALTSVVFPRNQSTAEHTAVLRSLGFSAYREEENDWIHEKVRFRPLMRLLRLADVYFPLTGQGGYVPKNEDGIVNLPGSRMYKPYFRYLPFLEGRKAARIKKQMRHAAENGLTFHLWWHPHNVGVRTDFHLAQLEEIFSYYDTLKRDFGMRSLNMGEAAADMLNG